MGFRRAIRIILFPIQVDASAFRVLITIIACTCRVGIIPGGVVFVFCFGVMRARYCARARLALFFGGSTVERRLICTLHLRRVVHVRYSRAFVR